MSLEYFEKAEYIAKKAERVQLVVEKYPKDAALNSFDTVDMIEILDAAAHISGSVRNCVKVPDPHFSKNRDKHEVSAVLTGRTTRVGLTPQGFLRVIAPPLLKMTNRRSLQISYEVEDAVCAYQGEGHAIPAFHSFIIVYKRFVPRIDDNSLCDNDNMETRKITNALVRCMGLSDNPRFASFLYTTIESTENLTEITVFPADKLDDVIVYIGLSAPEGCNKTCP